MNVIVRSNDLLKEELTCLGVNANIHIEWIHDKNDFIKYLEADAWIDLLFKPGEEIFELFKDFKSKPIILNSVEKSLLETRSNFIRINGWPTFLNRKVVEASCHNESVKLIAEKIFASLNRRVQWLPDEPGFIAARVVVMIINEAFFALEEEVSTRQDIDIAMRLGTNYPWGPFEWSEKIGLEKIYSLLKVLSIKNKSYEPSALLKKAATEVNT